MRKALFVVLSLVLVACAGARGQRPLNPRYYEAYYDSAYGPFIDGYWGRDERFFWYRDKNGAWHRDDKHHFQRGDGGPKWLWVRGSGVTRTNR